MSEETITRQLVDEKGYPVLVAEIVPGKNSLEAKIHEVEAWNVEEGEPPSVYEKELLLSGCLKWDGCADLDIGEGDSYQLHFCGRANARIVGRALDWLYDLGEELIPDWSGA